MHVEIGFRHSYHIPPYVELSPSTVMRNQAAESVGLQQSLRSLEDDLLVLEDISKLKTWLKQFKYRAADPSSTTCRSNRH